MTLTATANGDVPTMLPFLNSVSPGFSFLDENVHYSIKHDKARKGALRVDWPLTLTTTSEAQLEDTYLNIARPPLSTSSNESTTYVSLPYHVTNYFKLLVKLKDKRLDGNMHIAANVNPLNHDPYKLLDWNPGCISTIVELKGPERNLRKSTSEPSNKNPFNRLSINFNKLLKFSTGTDKTQNNFSNILPLEKKPLHIIEKLLTYNADTYANELQSPNTAKVLISSHVNVLNVIAIDQKGNYRHTTEIKTTKPVVPYTGDDIYIDPNETKEGKTDSAPASQSNKKVIEVPLLRIQFRQNSVISSMKSFINRSNDLFVILGFECGEVLILNLTNLTYQYFDDLGLQARASRSASDASSIKSGNSNYSQNFGNVPVTTLQTIDNYSYDFLILAGFANGEVMILNPFFESTGTTNILGLNNGDDKTKKLERPRYTKKVVGTDDYITYFKKFDLSPFTKKQNAYDDDSYPPYLVGHIKVTNKAVTSIASTIPYNKHENESQHPYIIAIASDDGLVRLIDLCFTYDLNYGNDEKTRASILTDVISNYFNEGVTQVEFSPDYKFLCIVGKGDLVEMFKLSYYNVNGLLSKNQSNISHHQSQTNISTLNSTGRRSRSGTVGTVNSVGSDSQPNKNSSNLFLSHMNITPSNSIDITRGDHSAQAKVVNQYYPPLLKDITAVCRLKGHSNIVKGVQFIRDELTELEPSNSSAYKLISYGFDAKINVWEFDYKALPKVKKVPKKEKDKTRKRKSMAGTKSPKQLPTNSAGPNRKISSNAPLSPGSIPIKAAGVHTRTRSINTDEFLPILNVSPSNLGLSNGTTMNMTTIMNSGNRNSEVPATVSETADQIEIVTSLYKSLFDLRTKRYYKTKTRLRTIFHSIVDDKLVPSIEIPLANLDFSCWIQNGKIDGVYLDSRDLYVFGKNGDIFKI